MPAYVVALWVGAAVVRAVAAVGMFARGDAVRYWPVSIFLALGAIRTAALWSSYWTGGQVVYSLAWISARPLSYLLDAVLALGAFHLVGRELPRFYPWAWRVVLVLLVASAPAGYLAGGFVKGWIPLSSVSSSFWLCFALLSWFWFWLFTGPGGARVSAQAESNLRITAGYFAVGVVFDLLLKASMPHWPVEAAQQIAAGACYAAWLIYLREPYRLLTVQGSHGTGS